MSKYTFSNYNLYITDIDKIRMDESEEEKEKKVCFSLENDTLFKNGEAFITGSMNNSTMYAIYKEQYIFINNEYYADIEDNNIHSELKYSVNVFDFCSGNLLYIIDYGINGVIEKMFVNQETGDLFVSCCESEVKFLYED